MCTTAPLGDTYVAALQHGLVEPSTETTLVGVVRRPTGWFHAAVDENRPALGPPPALLTEVQRRREDLKLQGVCDEGAHNAAWEDVRFEERYRDHLTTDPDARAAVDELVDRLRAGEPLLLVCFENTETKRCHRTLLRAHVTARLDRG